MTNSSTVTEELVREVIGIAQKYKKQVKIAYVDKKGNPENRILEPFDIKEKTFGGYCHLRNGYRSFSFNRVVRIVLTDFDHTTEPPPKKEEE